MPPAAIVTEPAKALPVRLKLAVVAVPALTALLIRASVVVNWLGIVSLMLPVNVDGPVLPTTSVKLVVPPTATVVLPTALVGVMLTTGTTFSTAVAVEVLVPTEVVSEPEGIVFVIGPAMELATTAETEQLEP